MLLYQASGFDVQVVHNIKCLLWSRRVVAVLGSALAYDGKILSFGNR